jgi:uncharacterized protein (DUF2225 family)
METLFQKTILCDQCNTQFVTSKVRSSAVRVIRSDTDYCSYYNGYNPNFYDVRVCPNCGSASTEKFNTKFNEVSRDIFNDSVSKNWKIKDFGGERSWEDALQSYKLALVAAQIREERDLIVAQLCHRIAWLYRERELQKEESRFLEFALKSYMKAYVNERADFNIAKLMYLIGDLHARTGNNHEAINWFGKIVNDKNITDQSLIQMTRDRWSELRSEG